MNELPKYCWFKKERGVVLSVSENRHCGVEGCRGRTLIVKWPDGKRSFPCTRGLDITPKGDYRIRVRG